MKNFSIVLGKYRLITYLRLKYMEKETNDYLNNLFTKIEPYKLSDEENKKILHDKMGFILDKLGRKSFRRFMSEKTRENIKTKIEKCMAEDKPIHFVIPFGGYKHFWSKSHPEPDWAEIFNFRFLTDYVSPILSVYEPGVIIEYISEDVIIPRMNNYTFESTEQYWNVFVKLMEWYKKFAPKNLIFTGFRIGDRFDKKEILEDVEKVVQERMKNFGKLSEEQKSIELKRSMRSVNWKGLKDLSSLSEKERMNRIIESRAIELAYYETEAKPQFLANYLSDNIMISFTFGTSPDNGSEDLSLKSNHGSVVDFWIGIGILEYKNGKFTPKTISKNQYDDLKTIKKIKIEPKILPFKNFEYIEVLASEN